MMTRVHGGYGLLDLGSIHATPEPTAPAASGATLPSISFLSEPHFKGFLDHMVKVARQLAHQGSGVLRAHATAAFHALSREPVQPLGVVRLYQAARLAAGGQGTDTQDPAILGQMGEFLEVWNTSAGLWTRKRYSRSSGRARAGAQMRSRARRRTFHAASAARTLSRAQPHGQGGAVLRIPPLPFQPSQPTPPRTILSRR